MVDMDSIKKDLKAEMRPRKLVRRAFVPQFKGIADPLKETLGIFVTLLGQMFVQAKLLPRNHPAMTGEIKGFNAIWQMIVDASAKLEFKRENFYQIAVFYAIVGMLVFGVLGAVTFMLHLGMGKAHAQTTTSMFSDTKVASTWIDQMFPVSGGGSGVAAALGPMILAYNECVLALATFVALWSFISFVMDSAHHGEVGGKRHSELWYPIRTVFALGMLVPVNNYNAIQMITVALAHAGSGMADYVWTQFETTLLSQPSTQYMGDVDMNEFLSQLMIISTCEEAALASGSSISQTQTPTLSGSTTTGYTISYNVDNQTGFCGSVQIPMPDQTLDPGSQNLYLTAYKTYYPTVSKQADCIVAQTIPSNSGNGTAASGGNASTCSYDSQTPPTYNWTTDIVTPLQTSVNQAAQNIATTLGNAQTTNQLQSMGASDGWVDAGTIFIQLAKTAANNANAQKREFSATLPDSSILPSSLGGGDCSQITKATGVESSLSAQSMCKAMSNMYATEKGKQQAAGLPTISITTDSNGGGLLGGLTKLGNPVKWAFDQVMKYTGLSAFFTFFVGLFSGSQASQAGSYGTTILNVVNYGNFIMNLELGLVLAIMVTGGSILGLGVAMALFLFATVFFPLAILLAIYVPLMPAMRFIFGIMTWLLTIFEALVAMPIVMLVHLKSDGEGLWAHGQQGYYMLLQMMLRPVLMIFGLVGAILLFDTLANFAGYSIIKTWLGLVSGGGNGVQLAINSFSELFPFLGFVMVYGYILYAIANLSFKLINEVPDRILTWIGAQSGIHSQDGTSDVIQNSSAAVGTALGVGATAIKSGVGNLALASAAEKAKGGDQKAAANYARISSLMPGGQLSNQLTHGAAGRYAEGSGKDGRDGGPADSSDSTPGKDGINGGKGEMGEKGETGESGEQGDPNNNNIPPPPDSM
jgi:hypothetical protein